ncbi:hypothetical protein [Amycolatopsis xylanica]|uniref:hypothetical protein n=1 Tax=Amycolatopsis xylanica TaxID=589385 RepID=UPI000B829700|nr:hypothetical protein [Amycolatopsis xylanica]
MNATDSHIGMIASEIHDSTVYFVLPDAPPEKKYRVGVAYLRDGVPSRARELIDQARALGHDSAEVRFHWMLAMLSKRSYRDLTVDERELLISTSRASEAFAADDWTRSLGTVHDLLSCLGDTGSDPEDALRQLAELPQPQRDQIVRHLDLVLTGSLKDRFWAGIRRNAAETRSSMNRENRVWAYFEVPPSKPRTRKPEPSQVTRRDRVRALLGELVAALGAGYLAKTLLVAARPLPIAAYLLAAIAAYYAIQSGFHWRYQVQRLAVKERQFRKRVESGSPGGFARNVSDSFDHYFHRYAPDKVHRGTWLAETAGVRAALRNEIVDVYRDQRVTVDNVKWLIRYCIRDVRAKWRNDTLFEHRKRYRASAKTKTICVLSTTTFAGMATYVAAAALDSDLLFTLVAALLFMVGTATSVPAWSFIVSERRREIEDTGDYWDVQNARQQEYERWSRKLADTMPSEAEMENWLNADKTIVLDEALKHYRLAWRDVLTHAFLQTPAENSRRARVTGGPYRYSNYDIRLFLITLDGVREVTTGLDFEHIKLVYLERTNFRFDAVSSVHVVTPTELSCNLALTLMNGEPRDIHVSSYVPADNLANGVEGSVVEMSLDAAGFAHTLHILEGIAAEGKHWIERDPYLTKPTNSLHEELSSTS